MDAQIVVLKGDGIGPEVVDAALTVLAAIAEAFGHTFSTEEQLIGGHAIEETGSPLPQATRDACRAADAVLLGAVGDPRWDAPEATVRPEQGLLGIRQEMGLYANLRPARPHPALLDASPLRPERLQGADLLFVRELSGGIYFGKPQGREKQGDEWQARDTMVYSESEIRRIAHLAFVTAQQRRGHLTSVDKANVLASSRLWRETVSAVAMAYPDVTLEHLLVDAAAMHLLHRPATFDVVVTANLFGDILTDEAAMLTGSLGNLPSASLGESKNRHDKPRGLYEPVHGSAPDIAGRGVANPIGAILSGAMLLRHSLGLEAEAQAIEEAVSDTLERGHRTADLAQGNEETVDTLEMAAAVVRAL